jgi:hypothetical protein
MSTNFEIVTVDKDGAEVSREHIGKRSAGWIFQFNGREHKTVAAWKARIDAVEGNETIEAENGTAYSAEDFWKAVQATKEPWGPRGIVPTRMSASPAAKRWTDNGFTFCGYEFC